jgi:hypothetical protein
VSNATMAIGRFEEYVSRTIESLWLAQPPLWEERGKGRTMKEQISESIGVELSNGCPKERKRALVSWCMGAPPKQGALATWPSSSLFVYAVPLLFSSSRREAVEGACSFLLLYQQVQPHFL